MKTMDTLECGMPKTRLRSYAYSTPEEPVADSEHLQMHLEHCGTCQNALAEYKNMDLWVKKLRAETHDAVRDVDLAQSLLKKVNLPWKEGRQIEVEASSDNELAISEMFMRRLTRKTCMDEDVAILQTNVENPALPDPLNLNVDVAVRYGAYIPDVIRGVRRRIFEVWQKQTGRAVSTVNVNVVDVFQDGVEVLQDGVR